MTKLEITLALSCGTLSLLLLFTYGALLNYKEAAKVYKEIYDDLRSRTMGKL